MLRELYISEFVEGEFGPCVVIGSNATGTTVMDVYGEDEESANHRALDVLTAFAIVEWLEEQLRNRSGDRLVAVADAMRNGATMIEAIRKNN